MDIEPRSQQSKHASIGAEQNTDIHSVPAGAQAPRADDAACVAAVLAGDRDRFGELIERYQHVILAVVRGYVQDAHAAEDVAQEIFISAFTSLRQLRQPAQFFPWLLQIARRRAALTGRQRDDEPLRGAAGLPDAAAPVHDESADAKLRSVLAAIEQLPEPYRQTLLQRYQAGMSCKEIAKQEDVAVGTITSRLTRALVMLRQAFL